MKDYILACLKLAGSQLACSLGCFLFVMMFAAMLGAKWGNILYSVLAIIIILDIFYSQSWTYGNKDQRDIKIKNNHLAEGEQPLSVNKLKGLYIGLCYMVINALFFGVFVFGLKQNDTVQAITTLIFRFWQCPFLSLLGMNGKGNVAISAFVSVLPILFITLGYLTGLKGKNYVEDFMYKLVYKRKKKKHDN